MRLVVPPRDALGVQPAPVDLVALETPPELEPLLVARVRVPLSSGDIHIVAQQAFSPATVLHNQDPRTLAVQLRGVEQH